MFKEFYAYNQNLLNAQYGVSEIIEHLQTRGEVREDFIRDIIKKRKRNLLIETGFLSDGNVQSPQCDIIIAPNNVPVISFGTKVCLNVADCTHIIEVKSNITSNDLKKCNEKAAVIKNMDGDRKPSYGVFCYKFKPKKNTLLRGFRFVYDSVLMEYEEDEILPLKYPSIDFILSISDEQESLAAEDVRKQFFLAKNTQGNGHILFNDYPSIKYFWRIIDGL